MYRCVSAITAEAYTSTVWRRGLYVLCDRPNYEKLSPLSGDWNFTVGYIIIKNASIAD